MLVSTENFCGNWVINSIVLSASINKKLGEGKNMNIQHVKIRAIGKMIAELQNGMYVDENSSAVVVCTDKIIHSAEISRIPHCCLQFIDKENPEEENTFTREQALIIRNFIFSLPDNITTLYCCCNWGQSRSAGLAAACMNYLEQEYSAVFDNSSYTPNLLVYSYMCEAFGLGIPSKSEIKHLHLRRAITARSLTQQHMARKTKTRFKRLIITGDTNLFVIRCRQQDGYDVILKDPDWSLFLQNGLLCPVEDCGREGKTIPQTGKDLISDRCSIGEVKPSDLVVVIYGITSSEEKMGDMIRKYLLWMKYVYPGINLLLVCPVGIIAFPRGSRLEEKRFSSRYREIAEELCIHYIDCWNWEEYLADHDGCKLPKKVQRHFSEYLAYKIMEIMA